MKRIVVLVLTFLLVTPGFSQEMFKYLTDKYSDKDGFSATLITNDMFDIYIRKKNIDKESPVFETLKNLDNILVVSQTNFGLDEKEDFTGLHNEIIDHYKKGNFTLLKTEKKMGEDIKVYLKKEDEKINSLALVTASSSSVTLVEMNGDIDMGSLSELSGALNIRGLENLYKVNGGSSFQFYGGTFSAPEIYFKNFEAQDFFTEEKIKELQERIKEQSVLSDEQIEQYQKQAEQMARKQAEMAEKYRQMAEQYGRQPIFLTTPGDTNVVYYINGEKVKTEDVKKLDKDKIQTIDVNKDDEKNRNVIRIITKK